MLKFILYPHGGSGNHGCEAIVRSTSKIIGGEVTLYSNAPIEDYQYGLQETSIVKSAQKRLSRFSIAYWKAFVQYRKGDKSAFDRAYFRPIFRNTKRVDYALSIGGDNYCYGMPEYILLINRQLRKQGVKTVLWGCSIEPEVIGNKRIFDDLKNYTHIVARESITYNALKEKGITQVSLFPDPAFQLERKDLPLPEGFVEGNTVGINISPMIISHEQSEGMTLRNYQVLIRHILNTTNMQIALIPHVVWSYNDDRLPLRKLYEAFKDSGRIVMLDDHNAEELKGFIARCRFMIVARTHASIAAYSEKVPTLVVGYSVKACGIARDLFGSEKHYVIPVQTFCKEDDLTRKFDWLYKHEDEVRSVLGKIMPVYKNKAMELGDLLKTL